MDRGRAQPAAVYNYTVTEEELGRLVLIKRDCFPKIGTLVSRVQSSDEWTDDILTNLDGWYVTTLEQTDLSPYCRRVLSALQSGVSVRDVGYIMLLAWNLSSTIDIRRSVFGAQAAVDRDVAIDALSNTIDFVGRGQPTSYYNPSDDESLSISEVRATCFLCASLLRLFTKETNSYLMAYERHIKDAYYKFYNIRYPLDSLVLDKGVLEGVKTIMNTFQGCKGTLAKFLYAHDGLPPSDKELCTLLFEQHLSFTGMHAVGLFLQVCRALRAPFEDLISALWHIRTKDALRCLSTVVNKYELLKEGDPKPIEKRTWKYARIFDQTKFAAVQTKNCVALVCTLALLCQKLELSGHQNIMDIYSIKKLPTESRDVYDRWATRIHVYFTARIKKTSPQSLETCTTSGPHAFTGDL